mmetsp:Transcript_37075/g.78632  ORF Transcript_37075/g.78632 Transcript_37075/m.78632 type:complete len:571 (+) Transcript_37075:1-1713(+)
MSIPRVQTVQTKVGTSGHAALYQGLTSPTTGSPGPCPTPRMRQGFIQSTSPNSSGAPPPQAAALAASIAAAMAVKQQPPTGSRAGTLQLQQPSSLPPSPQQRSRQQLQQSQQQQHDSPKAMRSPNWKAMSHPLPSETARKQARGNKSKESVDPMMTALIDRFQSAMRGASQLPPPDGISTTETWETISMCSCSVQSMRLAAPDSLAGEVNGGDFHSSRMSSRLASKETSTSFQHSLKPRGSSSHSPSGRVRLPHSRGREERLQSPRNVGLKAQALTMMKISQLDSFSSGRTLTRMRSAPQIAWESMKEAQWESFQEALQRTREVQQNAAAKLRESPRSRRGDGSPGSTLRGGLASSPLSDAGLSGLALLSPSIAEATPEEEGEVEESDAKMAGTLPQDSPQYPGRSSSATFSQDARTQAPLQQQQQQPPTQVVRLVSSGSARRLPQATPPILPINAQALSPRAFHFGAGSAIPALPVGGGGGGGGRGTAVMMAGSAPAWTSPGGGAPTMVRVQSRPMLPPQGIIPNTTPRTITMSTSAGPHSVFAAPPSLSAASSSSPASPKASSTLLEL